MQWTVLGNKLDEARYRALSEFLSSQRIENKLNLVDIGMDEFPARLQSLMIEKDLGNIRIEAPFREVVVKQFKKLPMLVAGIGAADCLVLRDGTWWPDTILFYAFNTLFSTYGSDLDLNGEVLVVGGGAAARFAVAAALRAGFTKINVTTKFDDQGISLVNDFKNRYFNSTFQFVPQDRLVLLPGTNVLLINTTPLAPDNDLLEELYYLNFLRQDGMIWDLVVNPGTTPLIREGEQIEIKCARGREIAAVSDQHWIEQTFSRRVPLPPLLALYERVLNTDPTAG